ncbi:MAG TPA: zinc ribbon domain-containing protein, partial [Armatimonadota bacterium]
MVHCRQCGAEIPSGVKYCPLCGSVQSPHTESDEQPSLPFSPWTPPPPIQPAGVGATARTETWGAPSSLSVTQVAVAVGMIFLFLAFVVLAGHEGLFGTPAPAPVATQPVPIIGAMGEAIIVGRTAWGVAFTDTVERVDDQPPQHGQFYAVGVVVGNKSEQ